MHERFEVPDRTLITHDQPPEVLPPRVGPLNEPAPPVASQLPPVLMRGSGIVAPLRDDRLNIARAQQRTHSVILIAAVGDQPLRLMRPAMVAAAALDPDVVARPFEEFDLRRGRLPHAYTERKTLAIGHNPPRRPRPRAVLPTRSPLCAPSRTGPRAALVPADLLGGVAVVEQRAPSGQQHTGLGSRPEAAWPARFEPYRVGRALQGAPVHKTQRMPSKHRRSLSGGRPPRL
jgi:hypothetical protein